MSLESVCAAIAEIAGREGSGVVRSFNGPPESLGQLPASWVNPVNARVTRGMDQGDDGMWIWTIELLVYVIPRRGNLPKEWGPNLPLVNSVERVFWQAFVAGDLPSEVDRCLVSAVALGIREYGGQDYHAITFTLDVKEHTP